MNLDGGASSTDGAKPTDAPVSVKETAPPKEASSGCTVDDTAQFGLYPETLPPKAAQGLCTTKQASDFSAACLGTAADQTKCEAFIAANKECSACIDGSQDNKALPVPVLYPVTADYVNANTLGCGFLVVGKPECALPAINYRMCYSSVCGACDRKDTAGTTKCETEAKAGVCKSLATTKECDDAFTAGKTQIDATCGTTSFDAIYAKVAAYLCGSGATANDAGPVDAKAD